MNIIKRRHAKEQGLKYYFTGKPCKKGHMAERLVSNGLCVECRKQYSKKWYQENRDHCKQRNKQWYHENAEYRQQYYKQWVQENPEYKKQWRQENPDKVNAINAKRHASKLQRTPKWLSEDDLWLIQEAYSLAKEREKATGIKWHVDHVVPLQGETVSGLHVPGNLQVIPGSENCSKNNNWNWDEQR